jgi:hypothetical protein
VSALSGFIGLNVKEVGLVETIDHIATMQRNYTANSIGQLVDIALQMIQDEAQSRAPVFTGRLRDSIAHQMTGPTSGICFVGVEYGAAQEFGFIGTNGQRSPGKNYFRPAAIHGRAELIKMLQEYMRLNSTRAGAKQVASGGFKGRAGRVGGAGAHKYQYKRVNAQGRFTYYYGKKSTTVTRRKALLHPGSGKQFRQTGRRRNIGRRTR